MPVLSMSWVQTHIGCYGLNCVPPKFIYGALISNVVLFGDRDFMKVIKVKCDP